MPSGASGSAKTLGWEVIDWVERHLCHGPGDVQGRPVFLTDEQCRFILAAYALDSKGNRTIRRAFLSRPKGWAKSELAGMLVCAEALGPVRFSHWDGGEARGEPVIDPEILCIATEEGQAGNTYDNVVYMLRYLQEHHGGDFPGLDIGLTRTFLPGGGEITPVSAKARSKDGGRSTFVVFDEALALDTPLPTPTGWTTVGDVQIGDRLIGSDGLPTEVLKVTPVYDDRVCWRVRFSDGTTVVASDGHQWWTRISESRALPRVRTTGEMAQSERRFRVPRALPLKTPDVSLPIDPYVLGLWLGDGDSHNATVTVAEGEVEETTERIRSRGYSVKVLRPRDRAPLLYISRTGSQKGRFSPVTGLKTVLREQGLFGNKHIPAMYLRAGTDQRVELLQGLMDSDGHIGKKGHCTFVNNSAQLSDDVTELLRSLGQVAGRGWQPDFRSRVGGTHRVWFTPHHLQPFALARKAERVREARRGPEWVSIVEIAPVATVPVRCVGVDAPDHLFLAGAGWNVTHNTHLFETPELRSLHATVRRNLGKRSAAEPWSLETSTMYRPGMSSVAESTHEYARQIADGRRRDASLLFDHREGPPEFDWEDDKELRKALKKAYGDADWLNFDRIVQEIRDPQSEEADSRRYWLNQVVRATEQAFDVARWRELAEVRTVPDKEPIALGFDGARFHDATALIGTHIESGYQFTVGVWERPVDAPEDWEVPEAEVDAAVEQAFDTWDVWRLYADPPYWEEAVNRWAGRFGEKRVLSWYTHRIRQMAFAIRTYTNAMQAGPLTHDGDETFARHIANARRRPTRMRDEDGRLLWVIQKENPNSPNKIDAAMAGCLSWECRADAISSGAGTKKTRRVVSF